MINENGLFSGGRIVAGYLWKYLKSMFPSSGDILFITGGVGDSAFYRTCNVAEELSFNGFVSSVTISDNPCLLHLAKNFKIFVFHKVIYSEKIKNFVNEIKKQNKEIVFETDDLNFDPQYLLQMDYYKNATPEERRNFENGLGREILEDDYVRVATTTTNYLARKIEEKGKKVFVVKNKISEREMKLADSIIKKEKIKDGFIRVGYFSGTPSHDKDFATIAKALAEILENHKNVKLVLAGPLEIDDSLNKFKERIDILPRVSRDKYYENIYGVDINLAPLELGNSFCESKSELKFIEAGVVGVPTVAVGNETYSGAIIDGADGFLAKTKEEWIIKLEMLISDGNLRKIMGEKAREKVLAIYTTKNGKSFKYYDYLKLKLNVNH